MLSKMHHFFFLLLLIMQIHIWLALNQQDVFFFFFFFKRTEDFIIVYYVESSDLLCKYEKISSQKRKIITFFLSFVRGCQNIKISCSWVLKICYLILFILDCLGKNLVDFCLFLICFPNSEFSVILWKYDFLLIGSTNMHSFCWK